MRSGNASEPLGRRHAVHPPGASQYKQAHRARRNERARVYESATGPITVAKRASVQTSRETKE
jgi:hypothetical protein